MKAQNLSQKKLASMSLSMRLGRVVRAAYIYLTTRIFAAMLQSKFTTLNPMTMSSAQRSPEKMFFNEAHMVGMLQHPNILPIYDAGEEDDDYYVVMEHIQGARTLEVYCRPDNLLRIEGRCKDYL